MNIYHNQIHDLVKYIILLNWSFGLLQFGNMGNTFNLFPNLPLFSYPLSLIAQEFQMRSVSPQVSLFIIAGYSVFALIGSRAPFEKLH